MQGKCKYICIKTGKQMFIAPCTEHNWKEPKCSPTTGWVNSLRHTMGTAQSCKWMKYMHGNMHGSQNNYGVLKKIHKKSTFCMILCM